MPTWRTKTSNRPGSSRSPAEKIDTLGAAEAIGWPCPVCLFAGQTVRIDNSRDQRRQGGAAPETAANRGFILLKARGPARHPRPVGEWTSSGRGNAAKPGTNAMDFDAGQRLGRPAPGIGHRQTSAPARSAHRPGPPQEERASPIAAGSENDFRRGRERKHYLEPSVSGVIDFRA